MTNSKHGPSIEACWNIRNTLIDMAHCYSNQAPDYYAEPVAFELWLGSEDAEPYRGVIGEIRTFDDAHHPHACAMLAANRHKELADSIATLVTSEMDLFVKDVALNALRIELDLSDSRRVDGEIGFALRTLFPMHH